MNTVDYLVTDLKTIDSPTFFMERGFYQIIFTKVFCIIIKAVGAKQK